MSFWIPVGFDRADGVTNLPAQPQGSGGGSKIVGTPNPAGALQVFGDDSGTNIQEDFDSPEIERAEQATFMHSFKTTFTNATNLISGLGRGTFVEDSFANVWRILSSKIQSMAGGYAKLSVVAESISFDSPPDEYQILPVESGIDILKHPRYSWALNPIASDSSTVTVVGTTTINYINIKESIIRMIQTYRDSPFFPSANQINGLIQTNILSQIKAGKIDVQVPNIGLDAGQAILDGSNPSQSNRWNGTAGQEPPGNFAYYIISVPVNLADPSDAVAIALAAAQEVIFKLWRQEDVPYSIVYQITLAQFFFKPQFLNPGGYIESPIGIVPDYFLSPSQAGPDTIFDRLSIFNPQSYAQDGLSGGVVSISWLRKADETDFQRTWFKNISVWLGSPIGHFDKDLYSGGNRPQNANDFNQNF